MSGVGEPKSPTSDDLLKVAKSLVAGGIAGAVSRTVVSPLERMKILFQIHNAERPTVTGTMVRIWKEEGWRGFYKGNGTNIVRIIPYSAVQFATYETIKKVLQMVDIDWCRLSEAESSSQRGRSWQQEP